MRANSSVRRGLSLIEMMVVVVILGIIAALVIPRVTTGSEMAKQKVRDHHVAQINAAIERYYVAEGSWPANLTDLVPDYLPDGVPVNPAGGAFSMDGNHRITYTP